MPDTLVRHFADNITPIWVQLVGLGKRVRFSPFGHPTRRPQATDICQSLAGPLVLTAKLMQGNHVLSEALKCRAGSSAAQSEDLRSVTLNAPSQVMPHLTQGESPGDAPRILAKTNIPVFAGLTLRQVQVLHLVLAGNLGRTITADCRSQAFQSTTLMAVQ
jgi:hypothetical protein